MTKRSRGKQKWANPIDWAGYAGSDDLQAALGVTNRLGEPEKCATFVAIDTESEKRGLINHVVEIGVTILRVRDTINISPGQHLRNWLPKMEHHHLVLDITRQPKRRMHSSLFGHSQFLSPFEAQTALKKVLRKCIGDVPSASNAGAAPEAYLVGQSINGDIAALRGAGVRLDLSDSAMTGLRFTKVFDTLLFSEMIKQRGAALPTAKLGWVTRYLGVDPQYVDPNVPGTVIGTHNASNDAAYTMMALCFYGLRWNELSHGGVLQPTPTAKDVSHVKKHLAEETTHTNANALSDGAVEEMQGRKHRMHTVLSRARWLVVGSATALLGYLASGETCGL